MKLILVTGASRGIGRATAERLAAPGHELILHGRDRAALEATAEAVAARGGAARVVQADLNDTASIASVTGAVGSGTLHAVIHCAGNAVVKPFEEVRREEWQRSLDLLLTAPFLLDQALLPRLSAGSSIVHVLSIAATQGIPGWSAYCAAKFGLRGLAASLREELRGRGVRVIDVYPAATATELWDGIPGVWPRERMLGAAEVAEAIAYAVSRPATVLVESVTVGDLSGKL